MEGLLKSFLALLFPPTMEAHCGHVPTPWIPLAPCFFPWPFECGKVEQMDNRGPAEHGCSVNPFS